MTLHEDLVTFHGDPQRAFATALQNLLPLGFQIEEQSAYRLVVHTPDLNSTRQNALLGVSRAEFSADQGSLKVQAAMGGVDRLTRSLLFIILGLGAFDTVLFTGLWFFLDKLREHVWLLAMPALALLPWIIITPIVIRLIGKRTREALHTLLENMTLTS